MSDTIRELRELLDEGERLDTTFQWLIERGQPERQVPTVWLSSLPDGDNLWTTDASGAAMFPTRESAEGWIYDHFTHPIHGASARAVEHGFMRVSREHSQLREAAVNALPALLDIAEAAVLADEAFTAWEDDERFDVNGRDLGSDAEFIEHIAPILRSALARLRETK